jgi:hypothetical protein
MLLFLTKKLKKLATEGIIVFSREFIAKLMGNK